MRNRVRFAPVAVALLLLCAVVVMAAPMAPKIDPQTKAVLDKMGNVLAKAKAFSVHADVCNEDVLPSGVKVQRCSSTDAYLERPDKLQVTSTGDLTDRSIWYDGKTLSVLFPAKQQYVTVDAPATLDETMNWAIQKAQVGVPLMDFLYSDPLSGLLDQVRLTHYLGDSEVSGVKCKHMAFKQADINWQLWVEDSPIPVPRKIVIEYKNEPGTPEYTAVLSDWTLLDSLPDERFVFTPPEGAHRIQMTMPTREVK